MTIFIMNVDISMISINCSSNAVSQIIEQVGVVVGARHEVLGHIVQHVGLVSVDRILN